MREVEGYVMESELVRIMEQRSILLLYGGASRPHSVMHSICKEW